MLLKLSVSNFVIVHKRQLLSQAAAVYNRFVDNHFVDNNFELDIQVAVVGPDMPVDLVDILEDNRFDRHHIVVDNFQDKLNN